MPVEYTIDKELELLVGRASGSLTPRDLIEGFGRVVEATDGAAVNMDHLFVHAPGTQLDQMDAQGMMAMKDSLEAHHARYPGRTMRTAIVVSPNDPQDAVAKLWQAIIHAHPETSTDVQLFDRESDALDWLTLKAS
jgi:hypothetical protein